MATIEGSIYPRPSHTKILEKPSVHLILEWLLVQAGVEAKLFPYQLNGLARMLFQQAWTTSEEGRKANLDFSEDYGYFGKQVGLGIMQSDATGLGKTLQTLCLGEVCRYVAGLATETIEALPLHLKGAVKEVAAYPMTKRLQAGYPILIVCPLSVFMAWKEDLKTHTRVGEERIMVYHGSNRSDLLEKMRVQDPSKRPWYVLTTPQTLVSDGGLRQAKAKRTILSAKMFGFRVSPVLEGRATSFTKGNRRVKSAPMRRPILRRMDEKGVRGTLVQKLNNQQINRRINQKTADRKRVEEEGRASRFLATEALRKASKEKVLARRREMGRLKMLMVPETLDRENPKLWTTKGFWFRQPLAALFVDEAPYSTSSSMWQALYALTGDPFLFRVIITASPICNSIGDLAARLTLAGFSPHEWGSPPYLALIDPRPVKDEATVGGSRAKGSKAKVDSKEVLDSCSTMVKRLQEVAMICRPKTILGPLLPPLKTLCQTIPLSPLERHFYNDALRNTSLVFRQFLASPDLASRQSAWSKTLLRLLRLRQVTTHPAITLGRSTVSRFCEAETQWLLWRAKGKEGPEPPRPSDKKAALMRHESSKFAACAAAIKDARAKGIKTLVISQWTAVMDLFEIYLFGTHGLRSPKFDGRLNLEERTTLLQTFREADPAKLPTLLLQLQAGGVGLTITGTKTFPVSQVIFLDSWFNPCAEDQARDRVWRQSQTRPVLCQKLDSIWSEEVTGIGSGTIDTAVRFLQKTKKALAKVYIGHGEDALELEGAQEEGGRAGLSLKEAKTLLEAVICQDEARNE